MRAAPPAHSEAAPRSPEARRGGRWAPGVDDVYLVGALAAIVIPTLGMAVAPNDFWFHIATGREMVSSGGVPAEDTFSFTRGGEPFFNQPWLAQLALYGSYRLGGLELVVFLNSIVISAAAAALIRLCRELGGSKRLTAAAVALMALPLGAPNFGVRPQAFGVFLFAAMLWVVWGARRRATADRAAVPRRLWLIPPALLLWSNLHGSFPLGVVLIAGVIVGDAIARRAGTPAPPPAFDRRLALFGALGVAASLIHPAGWAVWGYVADVATSSSVTAYAMEWRSPSMQDGMGIVFFSAALALAGALALSRAPPDPVGGLLGAGFFLLAASALRHMVWFGFVAAPLVVTVLPGRLADRPGLRGSPAANGALIALLAVLAALALPWVRSALPGAAPPLYGPHTPVAGARALDELDNPPSRPFHDVGYGSYLTWARPDSKVFIDPRFELYPAEMWSDYRALSTGYDVERLFERYEIDGVLADRELQAGLVSRLRDHDAWDVAREDPVSVLFLPAGEDR